MNGSPEQQQIARSSSSRRRPGLVMGIVAVTLMLFASLVALSLAAGGSATVSSAANAKLGKQIVVGAVGLEQLKEKIGIARCGKASC